MKTEALVITSPKIIYFVVNNIVYKTMRSCKDVVVVAIDNKIAGVRVCEFASFCRLAYMKPSQTCMFINTPARHLEV